MPKILTAAMLATALMHSQVMANDAYQLVTHAAQRYGVPQSLAHGVAKVESGHRCVNGHHMGPMQISRSTARAIGGSTVSCAASVDAAMRYLAMMYRSAGGDHCRAATAFNRGHVGGCSSYGRRASRGA